MDFNTKSNSEFDKRKTFNEKFGDEKVKKQLKRRNIRR